MKKKILGFAAVTLAAVLIAGGSYAYLQSTTGEKTNTFTMGEGVKGEIAEPRWDGLCFSNGDCIDAEGNDLSKDPLFAKGSVAASNFIPGAVISKDPMVKNTSQTTPVYTAIKISYGNGINSYNELNKFASIDFNTTNWTFNSDYTVAYYNSALAAGEKTEPAFKSVTIKNEATDPTLSVGNPLDTDMKNFDITVQGFFTQTNIEGVTTPKSALDLVFGDLLK